MVAQQEVPAEWIPDLADVRLGGAVVEANDLAAA
jgi:hypothetical protein